MKVAVIGAGMVGKEVFHYLFHFSGANELLLIDINKEKAEAEILDFSDTLPLKFNTLHKKISYGDFADMKDSHIVVINVSIKQLEAGRNTLAQGNNEIMKSLAGEIKKYAPGAFVIITSNPVDTMTYYFLKYSGFSEQKVISMGTLLDTIRLNTIASAHYNLNTNAITGFVLGEHGPTAFVPWSLFKVLGMDKSDFERENGFSPLDENLTLQQVIARGGLIFKKRPGYTDHGIGASVCKIVNAILQDEKIVLPVGSYLTNYLGVSDVVLSVPCVIGAEGIEKRIILPFNAQEKSLFHLAYKEVRSVIESVS